MSTSQVSSLLSRLVGRGAVQIAQWEGRQKIYQAAERLFNIYYLMRRRGQPSNRVRTAVAFMVQYYEGRDLTRAVGRLAREACNLSRQERQDHYWAYQRIVLQAPDPEQQKEILHATPECFFNVTDVNVLELTTPILDEAAEYQAAATAATELAIEIAAAGLGEEILQRLLGSKGCHALEPLAVGLRIYLGEEPKVAQEIKEVGKDVAERIRKREGELSKRRKTK